MKTGDHLWTYQYVIFDPDAADGHEPLQNLFVDVLGVDWRRKIDLFKREFVEITTQRLSF
jgi:hypothetical protein